MVTQSYPRWANRIARSGRKAVVLNHRHQFLVVVSSRRAPHSTNCSSQRRGAQRRSWPCSSSPSSTLRCVISSPAGTGCSHPGGRGGGGDPGVDLAPSEAAPIAYVAGVAGHSSAPISSIFRSSSRAPSAWPVSAEQGLWTASSARAFVRRVICEPDFLDQGADRAARRMGRCEGLEHASWIPPRGDGLPQWQA
jgi:hypothetical protein